MVPSSSGSQEDDTVTPRRIRVRSDQELTQSPPRSPSPIPIEKLQSVQVAPSALLDPETATSWQGPLPIFRVVESSSSTPQPEAQAVGRSVQTSVPSTQLLTQAELLTPEVLLNESGQLGEAKVLVESLPTIQGSPIIQAGPSGTCQEKRAKQSPSSET